MSVVCGFYGPSFKNVRIGQCLPVIGSTVRSYEFRLTWSISTQQKESKRYTWAIFRAHIGTGARLGTTSKNTSSSEHRINTDWL